MTAPVRVFGSLRWCVTLLTVLGAIAWPGLGLTHAPRTDERLSKIGPAPEFALTNQDGRRLA